jgi:transcriptional regulator with XRE-family HTH domain
MGKANHLGEYLRARRGQTTPAEVGLVPGPRRRVAGRRRDELALLAGITSEYLPRLEQGRDRHPSVDLLDAIARALRMDATATAYLHLLARPARRAPGMPDAERARAIAELIAQFPMPAIVVNRYQEVLAANSIARALSPGFQVGQNLSRCVSSIPRPGRYTPTGTKQPPRQSEASENCPLAILTTPACTR